MSVTSGFFNSFNHDRRYNAEQMSAIFNGIINDGVFASIGTAFAVTQSSGVTVNVGIGRAWFNSTWLLNDAILPITLDISEVVLDRIDAVVIEIDRSDSVRAGSIKVVNGTPASEPENPTLLHTEDVNQYPIAYIYRTAGSGTINQADITNMVGTSACPYITGLLQVINIDNQVAQWKAQWDQWFANTTSDSEEEASAWFAESKAEFDAWFEALTVALDENVAATLEAQILDIQQRFNILVSEGAIYDDLKDSDGELIEDSQGSVIQAKTVLTSGAGSGSGDVDQSQINDIWEAVNGKQDKVVGTPGDLVGISSTGGLESVNARPRRVNVTLTTTGWNSLSQTVSVPGISADESTQTIQAIPKSTSKADWKQYGIEPDSQAQDSLTFKARSTPGANIEVYVVIQEVVGA